MNNKKDTRMLARTASEIKKYRMLMKIIPALISVTVAIVIIIYIASVMYSKLGSFTVMINKFDNAKYALSLSETPDFHNPSMRLNSKASEEITCISTSSLPKDLDMINGAHNGKNYVAYTFYLKNAGTETFDCESRLYMVNATKNVESAIRIRLYTDGECVDYARTRADGTGPEPDTTEFYDNTVIAVGYIEAFKPQEMKKYTVVIWLEGDDPECKDDILGGEFKIDMSFSIINDDDENSTDITE